MSYPISLGQNQTREQNLKQTQRLMMTPQMQQAIRFLQMPVLELTSLIEAEMEQNPILEYLEEEVQEKEEEEWEEESHLEEKEIIFEDQSYEILKQIDEEFRDHFAESGASILRRSAEEDKKKTYQESSIQDRLSLYDYLLNQAKEVLQTPEEFAMAEILLGYLDSRGFLLTPLEEIAALFEFEVPRLAEVLKVIQTFEPLGIAAKDLKESLLIQLRCLKKENSLAYAIIENHFNDLLHNRIPLLKKELNCSSSDIQKAIDKDIAKLDLHPGTSYSKDVIPYVIADVTLRQDGDNLTAEINEDFISPLKLNSKYLKMLEDTQLSAETKQFIKVKILSAKWLIKNIFQRNETIERIATSLAKRQKTFFLHPEGKLIPLTMKTIAEELDLHESTIARAVANKYIDTPRGLFPLRFFFSNTYVTDDGEDISAKTVKDVLQDIVKNEDKCRPLSDESISKLIKMHGISCARRTIAKYRRELNIGTASQRKKF